MMQDFNGADVIDNNGDKIGTVERTYDDAGGTPRFVEVTMGSLFSKKQRLVPVDSAQMSDDGLQVPFSKGVIEDSPDAASAGDTLEGGLLDSVHAFYRGDGGEASADTSSDEEQAGAVPVGEADTGNDTLSDQNTETTQDTGNGGQTAGTVRDLGDVIEVPIYEERLVKQPVVAEVLRIRKTPQTQQQSVEADLRKEEVEVVKEGDVVVHGDVGENS